MTALIDLSSHWHDLFGAALLGADRRRPPVAPPGPVSELLVELAPADGASELLEQVAATAALRRAGAAPLPPVAALQPPGPDSPPSGCHQRARLPSRGRCRSRTMLKASWRVRNWSSERRAPRGTQERSAGVAEVVMRASSAARSSS